MNRQDAFRDLHTLCQRLDTVTPATFPVVPRRAYLFGSVLTDKTTHPTRQTSFTGAPL